MPTIHDIAKAAGVSSGTVSNVLNNKGNVRADKIKRVEDAIASLGYEVNESAKTLRRQTKRTVALLVPNMRSRHYIEVYEILCHNLQQYNYDIEIYSTDNLYEHEKAHLRKMISANVAAIVSFPTYIHSGELYNKIPESIYLVVVGPRPNSVTRQYLHVSFDYEQIANDISDYVLEHHYKRIGFFIDSVRFSTAFKDTILQRLNKAAVSVNCVDSTNRNAVVRGYDLLDKKTHYDAVITSNALRAQVVWHAYSSVYPDEMPEIITLSATNTIFESMYTSVFLDYQTLANWVCEVLVNAMVKHKSVNPSYILNSEGIGKRQLTIPYYMPQRALSILAVEDSCTLALPKLLPQFERMAGVKVNLSFYPRDLYRNAQLTHSLQEYDLLITDMDTVCAAAPEQLPFLKKEAAPELWRQMCNAIDPLQTYFPSVAEKNLCLSFNTSCQMLFYRKDWLREQSIARKYYERFYTELAAPDTLNDFDNIAQFFSQELRSKSEQLYGVSMSSIGSEGFWSEFYTRLWAGGASLLDADGKLSLCRPVLAEEIRKYLQLMHHSNVKSTKNACSGIDEFVRGNSVMSLFSTANAHLFSDSYYGPIADCVSCHDVPGGMPVIEGNVIGLLAHTHHPDESLSFLSWLFHDMVCNVLTLLSGQPVIKSSTKNTEVVSLFPWLKYFNRNFDAGSLITSHESVLARNPGFAADFAGVLSNAFIDSDQLDAALRRLQQTWQEEVI